MFSFSPAGFPSTAAAAARRIAARPSRARTEEEEAVLPVAEGPNMSL